MTHAHHFLSRLDRLQRTDVELALTLYNDAQLVREVLFQAALPEGVDRVALTLGDRELGPFVVVTRDGHFVTCLGAGMHTNEFIVPRAVLDSAVALGRQYARLEELKRSGRFRQILHRIENSGPAVAREDIEECAAIAPVAVIGLYRHWARLGERAHKLARSHFFASRKQRNLPELAGEMYNTAWALAHTTALCAESFGSMYQLYPDVARRFVETMDQGLCSLGSSGLQLMAAWAMARIGSTAFQILRRPEQTGFRQYYGSLGLLAVGFRHPGLEPAVRRILEERVGEAKTSTANEVMLARGALQTLDHPQRALKAFLVVSRASYAKAANIDSASVDDCLALALEARRSVSFLEHDVRAMCRRFLCLPWLAKTSIGELYLPRSALKQTQGFWAAEREGKLSVGLLRRPPREPERRATPRRHEPCNCGSGVKYRKCCGKSVPA